MKLSFDKFERYELPQVILCNPNSRAIEVDGKITITDTVGVLSNPKGMNLKLNFNAPHELSFDYYRHKSSDPIKQSFYDSIYEAIQTDRYVYLTDIGYFIISNVNDSDEDNIDKKSISLKSCEENEFAVAEGLNLDEKTYYLHTDNNDGLLDLFLPKTAGWTIGFIDPSLLEKPYYVEKTEVDNGYNFLYTTIQDMFECIVEPDIIRRTVSVYSRVYYAEHHLTDIHIAKYNLLKHKTVEENDEDKYTALNVQGKDESLEIRTVNPTGKNVIYNFESRYSWMSSALQDAVENWQDKCESVEDKYLTLQQDYYNDMQNIVFPLEQDIKVLEFQLKQQQQTRDLIVIGEQDKAINIVESLPQTGKSDILYFIPITVNNYEEYVWENDSWKYIASIKVDDISDTTQQGALNLVNAAINNTNTTLSNKQSTLDIEKKNVETKYLQPISQINSECALETTSIFSTELRNELMTHIKPTDYIDEYMLVTESMTYPERFEKAKELMDRAQSQLIKISSGQKTYSIDTRSFLFNKQFKHFSEQLCAGAIIYVETKSDTMEQLHLTGIDINFDEKSTNFTLGNKYDRSDLKALYEDTLGQNSKSFNELKYIAGIVEDQKKYVTKDWAAELRTLTLDNVLTSEDQAIEINNRGLIGRKRQVNEDGNWKTDENGNPLFDSEQVKLINNTLVFTDNNWQNATTAVGKIAVGYDANGNVKYAYGINGQVLIGELILGNNLVLTGTGAGIKIKDNNQTDVFYADDSGNLNITGKITALEGGSIGGWQITGSALLKDVTLDNNDYRVFMQAPDTPTVNTTAFAVRNITTGKQLFNVTYGGRLVAADADITGKITADSGTIGGFSIADSANSVFTNAISKRVTDGTTQYEVGMKGDTRPSYLAFYVKKSTDSWKTSEDVFGVTHAGAIIANEGRFGGWNIKKSYIYGRSTNNGPYTVLKSSGSVAFAAGVPSDWKPDGDVDAGETATTGAKVQIWHNGDVRMGLGVNSGGTDANYSFVVDGDTGNINIKNSMLTADSPKLTGTPVFSGGPRFDKNIYAATSSTYSDSVCYLSIYSPKYHTSYSTTNNAMLIQTRNSTSDTWKTEFVLRYDGKVTANGGISTTNLSITGSALPNSDGSSNLGNSNHRWAQLYAKTATINTSDRNTKENIAELTDVHKQLFMKLIPVSFTFVDGTSGRTHIGFISQDVEDAMTELGMTSLDFAGFCKDIKTKVKIDENGHEIEVPDLDNQGNKQYLYALRYEEFIGIISYVLQDTVGKLDLIEERLLKLENINIERQ